MGRVNVNTTLGVSRVSRVSRVCPDSRRCSVQVKMFGGDVVDQERIGNYRSS